ncbi:MAG: hypothetical protein H6724_12355 [Sandaracinus sp.]|nr:hypothetical protein [Sandaracinus sp.]
MRCLLLTLVLFVGCDDPSAALSVEFRGVSTGELGMVVCSPPSAARLHGPHARARARARTCPRPIGRDARPAFPFVVRALSAKP